MAESFSLGPKDVDFATRRAVALRDAKARLLGALIRELRQRDDRSREEIAAAAGVPAAVLFQLENGILPFDELDQETLRALAKGMGEVLPGSKDLSVHALCEGAGFSLEDLKPQ